MANNKQDCQSRLLGYLDRYRQSSEVHPALAVLGLDEAFEQTFLRVLHHDYDTINARSPYLDDHEITITQKAFTILMQNEKDHQGAVQLYIEELLGFQCDSVLEDQSMIKDAIRIRATFLDEIRRQANSDLHLNHYQYQPNDDPKLLRLEALCEKAKADFETSGHARYDKANAAKFLRDTVENTIIYMKSCKSAVSEQGYPSSDPIYDEKLQSLEEVYQKAARAARDAHRGEVRPFEKSSANLVPISSARHSTPISKDESAGYDSLPLHMGRYEVSETSKSFPTTSLPPRPRGGRSASPRKRSAYTRDDLRRSKLTDRYRPG